MILYSEGASRAQEDEANAILDALSIAYPGHPWGVRVYDGGFFIRHLDFPKSWGMNCRHGTRLYSASALKREVILMAGEWLERAHIARSRYDADQEPYRVEGVPEKDQPGQPLENMTAQLSTEHFSVREEPRPQALREEEPTCQKQTG